MLLQAVPPPVEQLTADCRQPTYASDILICSDFELREANTQLDRERLFPFHLPMSSNGLWETDVDWFKRRSLCAFQAEHARCLTAAYTERRALLSAVRAFRGTGDWVCSNSLGKGLVGRIGEAGILVFGSVSAIEGAAAAPARRADGWNSFVTYARQGNRLTVRQGTSSVLRCRKAP